jgi:tetrahydromethanopterin S-methyltransferase subunit B
MRPLALAAVGLVVGMAVVGVVALVILAAFLSQ